MSRPMLPSLTRAPRLQGGVRSSARRTMAAAIVLALIATLTHAPVAAARDFLWRVSGTQSSVYLVGSVHLLAKDYYPLSPVLDAAFNQSDLLVEEADLDELLAPESQLQILTRGMLPSNQSLDNVVSAQTFAEVAKHASAVGMPLEPLKRFRPWLLALTMVQLEWQKAGFDAALGLDKHFYDRAKRAGKEVRGLETAAYQIARFDGMSAALQERMLANTLKDAETEMANVVKVADAWKQGDAATIERLVLDAIKDDREMYERLLVERNRNWLPKIEALFSRQTPAFIVVGAAHLVGPDGLLAMLKAAGYAVEQQ